MDIEMEVLQSNITVMAEEQSKLKTKKKKAREKAVKAEEMERKAIVSINEKDAKTIKQEADGETEDDESMLNTSKIRSATTQDGGDHVSLGLLEQDVTYISDIGKLREYERQFMLEYKEVRKQYLSSSRFHMVS